MDATPFVKPHRYLNVEANPPCPHCGATHTRRKGYDNRKQRYHCAVCKKSWGGPIPEPRPLDFCPNCSGRCVHGGISPTHGTQQYLCRGCGKLNVNLYPVRPQTKVGPIKRAILFYLDERAFRVLDAYCRGTKMSAGDAVRRIFGEAARPEYNSEDGDAPPLPIFTTQKIPKLPDSRRRRHDRPFDVVMSTGRIVLRIGVTLDPTAFMGLLRTMEEREMHTQDAARFLLSDLRCLQRRGIAPEAVRSGPKIILPASGESRYRRRG